MGDLTEKSREFREYMGGFFHDVFRAAGLTMLPVNSNEKVRRIGERMAASIEHNAERKAVQVIKKLQTAVMTAFVKMEAKLSGMHDDHDKFSALLKNLIEDQEKTKKELVDLKHRLNRVANDHLDTRS